MNSPSFNIVLDNFTANVSGNAGDLNISVTMNNASDNYNLTANDIHIEYQDATSGALIFFNYTGLYPASLTVKWNLTWINYDLSGYVVNILNATLNNSRVDINGTYVFTNATGYYKFSNIHQGNYTLLVRQIGYRNNSQSLELNSTKELNVTLVTNKFPAVRPAQRFLPGFEGLGLLVAISIIYIFRRKYDV